MAITNSNGSISYDPELLASTINKASALNNQNVDFSSLVTAVNSFSIPNGNIAAELSALVKDAMNIFPDEIDDLFECLKDVKQKYDECIGYGQEDIQNLISQYGGSFEFTKIGNQEGWLYLPSGYSSTNGLPLIVFMAGSGENKTKDGMISKCLPAALSNGLAINAAVWCPLYAKSKNPSETTFNNIVNMVDTYGFDKERISVIGYSQGSVISQHMVSDHPDYFSTFVSTGTRGTGAGVRANIKTKTIIVDTGTRGTKDDNFGTQLYNALANNGTPVIRYKINGSGSGHGTTPDVLVNEGLLSDLITIKKSDNVSMPSNTWVEVDYSEAYGASILAKQKGTYASSSFYKRLTNNTYVPANVVGAVNTGSTQATLVKTPEIDYAALKGKYNIEYDANAANNNTLPVDTSTYTTDVPKTSTAQEPVYTPDINTVPSSKPSVNNNVVTDGHSTFTVLDTPANNNVTPVTTTYTAPVETTNNYYTSGGGSSAPISLGSTVAPTPSHTYSNGGSSVTTSLGSTVRQLRHIHTVAEEVV